MKTKKNARVSLEKKRHMFFLFGLTFALGGALMAFEWKSDETNHIVFENGWDPIEVELPPVTTPPEPPKPKIQTQVTVFDIVEPEDETMDIEDIDFADTEYTDEAIEIITDPDPEPVLEVIEFVKVETKPSFKGGDKAFYKYLKNNLEYPEVPKDNNVEAVVYVCFTIDTDGKIIDARPARPGDKYLDAEAVRVFNKMPKWNPGKQRGQNVKVSYVLPIRFALH